MKVIWHNAFFVLQNVTRSSTKKTADRLQILPFIILSLSLPFRLNKVNTEVIKTKDKTFLLHLK